jgi:hypothetical protein
MNDARCLPEDDPAPAALLPILDFLAFCLERPAVAATRVAAVVTLAALIVLAGGALIGAVTGAGLTLVYVTFCWAVCLYLRRRSDGVAHDA